MVQISSNNQYIRKNPAFCGYTRVFKNRLFSNASTYEQILATADKQPYVGSLPKEIIEAVCAITHSKEEKTAFIKKIMNAFSQAAQALKDDDGLYLKTLLSKDVMVELINKQKQTACEAGKILTSAFKSLGLIKKRERIIVSRFNGNEGAFGIVFRINFPKSTEWTRKVIKIFKNIKFNRAEHLPLHGVAAETCAAMFIKKQQGKGYKKSIFVEPYLASLKDDFMLTEYVYNYPKKDCTKYTISKAFEKINIHVTDVNTHSGHNLLNGRIIDYGKTTYDHENLTPDAYKVFRALNRADIKSINTGSDKPVIDALVKYVKGSQKETKVSRFDADRGVEAFMGNTAFSEATKDILVKLKLFKPEQISTY